MFFDPDCWISSPLSVQLRQWRAVGDARQSERVGRRMAHVVCRAGRTVGGPEVGWRRRTVLQWNSIDLEWSSKHQGQPAESLRRWRCQVPLIKFATPHQFRLSEWWDISRRSKQLIDVCVEFCVISPCIVSIQFVPHPEAALEVSWSGVNTGEDIPPTSLTFLSHPHILPTSFLTFFSHPSPHPFSHSSHIPPTSLPHSSHILPVSTHIPPKSSHIPHTSLPHLSHIPSTSLPHLSHIPSTSLPHPYTLFSLQALPLIRWSLLGLKPTLEGTSIPFMVCQWWPTVLVEDFDSWGGWLTFSV